MHDSVILESKNVCVVFDNKMPKISYYESIEIYIPIGGNYQHTTR